MAFANDGVELPIPQAGTVRHNGRPRVDGDPVTQLAAPVIGPVAFLACLLATQMAVKIAALGLVLEDMLIDPLMADGNMAFFGQP